MSVIYFFHKHMKTIFIITIAGFITATFAGFGGYYLTKKQNIVAKVNNTKITSLEYNKQFNEILTSTSEERKQALNENDINKIRTETMQTLIRENLLLTESKKIGVWATDKEISNIIKTYPLFQRNGYFDKNIYFSALKYKLRQTPNEFENAMRKRILIDKTKYAIANAVKVSEKELEYEYFRINKSMKNYDKEKESFKQSYLSNKKILLLNLWFRNVANKSTIKIYKDNSTAS